MSRRPAYGALPSRIIEITNATNATNELQQTRQITGLVNSLILIINRVSACDILSSRVVRSGGQIFGNNLKEAPSPASRCLHENLNG